ncbi:tyrosine-type recombinase/integrase [Aneurinibacillus thermoaerophilus]|uniref:tyrosine-type recombinase/integrase n=1 Tax=Aneurinibacillus thermoaerophilus TaxID=143495 RepID=UPI002E1FFFF9|nr:tyrosine-type recombinase/integrase [Aneurinibacillus thermoaerophilus]MED0676310.1 tyrosine-type recombinase/integrase [Aneurinibacillus thermoaerophilus]
MLLKFAAKDFLDDREFKNVSPTTLDRYTRILAEFQDFCAKDEIVNVEDVSANIVKKYLTDCHKRGNKSTTVNTKLRGLKAFFNYMVECEVITEKRNPTTKIGYAKEEVKIEVFTDYHIQQMLGYYRRLKSRDKSFFAYRDYTIIVFLLGTGVRLGELCNLKWNDVNLVHDVLTVFGKKREQSSIPITEKLKKELAEYKIFCEQWFGTQSEYVFTDADNRQLTPNAVKCVFKRLKEIMNFKDVRLSAHTFRHTFAHRMLMAGCDVFTLQKMLRHSSIEMTQKYLSLWGIALKEQNEKFNPLNNLDI